MAVRVRKDIWDLGDEADPWRDPAILAYARAVAAMQKVDTTNPKSGASWRNQAAIHERRGASRTRQAREPVPALELVLPAVAPDVPVPLRADRPLAHAREHGRHVGAAVLELHERRRAPTASAGVSPAAAARRQAQPAVRRAAPDASRWTSTAATRCRAGPSTTQAALAERVFTRRTPGATAGFGGSKTGFSHSGSGIAGPLEQTPHGAVHVAVGGSGGFMSAFDTAALDPIFWLHHCNLDRLWERWLRAAAGGHPPGRNPTDSAWLNRKFELINRNGNRVKLAVKAVLDIEGQLNYTYSGLPTAAAKAGCRRADGDR